MSALGPFNITEQRAIQHELHNRVCPGASAYFPCATCPRLLTLGEVLVILVDGEAAPSTVRPARRHFHDAVCINGTDCSAREWHSAHHTVRVRELRKIVRGHLNRGTLP